MKMGLVLSVVWIAGFALALAADGKFTQGRFLRGLWGAPMILGVTGIQELRYWFLFGRKKE
ncbi:MAG: hypothetical protein HZC36_08255 [Armatimonadetes bacterium]|nr:hypothetical protein [Armatimonadota bacterium]